MRRTPAILAVLALLTVGGSRPNPGPTARTRHGMRQHALDLRTIELHLLRGELELAQMFAYMLTRPTPGLGTSPEAHELALAASVLADAPTVEDALRAEVRVASACATCHEARGLPPPKLPPHAPPDLPTLAAQMARHQWAADRLWEGIVAPSDAHWKSGLYVLASTNVALLVPDHPSVARELRDRAATAFKHPARDTAARAATYGDVLVVCWGCHSARIRSR